MVNKKLPNLIEGVKFVGKPRGVVLKKDFYNLKTNTFLNSKAIGFFMPLRNLHRRVY